MSARYRKRPVVIDAVQFDGTLASVETLEGLACSQDLGSNTIQIETLEGVMTAQPGDWIVRGVKGEHYPIKPDIFATTYGPANEVAPEVAALLSTLEAIALCKYDQDDEHRMRHMASSALQAFKEGAHRVV